MKSLDRFLQYLRIQKAKKYISRGSYILDIGCHDGALFKSLGNNAKGVGIDPKLNALSNTGNYQFVCGNFPNDLSIDFNNFDVITALAILEHVPTSDQKEFVKGCERVLKKDGLIIITVPSIFVDKILAFLLKLHLIDGMDSFEEHHGFDPKSTETLFLENEFNLLSKETFEFGLNHLYIFQRKS